MLINEGRFFSEVLPKIGNKRKIIEELVENATRSHARNVDITLTENTLTCVNDGKVLTDWMSLFQVATTAHDEKVIANQNPAGMGIMMLLAASQTASFHSGFIKINIDCAKFFSSGDYRKDIEKKINNIGTLVVDDRIDGMKCVFTQDDGFFNDLLETYNQHYNNSLQNTFGFYPINIIFNGNLIPKQNYDFYVDPVMCQIEGLSNCLVGIEANSLGCSLTYTNGYVHYFGKVISCLELKPFTIIINDLSNTEIKPSLPDRTRIINDENVLARIRRDIESALKTSIQNKIDFLVTSKQPFDKTSFFSLLNALRENYDLKDLNIWPTYMPSYSGGVDFTNFSQIKKATMMPCDVSIDDGAFLYPLEECDLIESESLCPGLLNITHQNLPHLIRHKIVDEMVLKIVRDQKHPDYFNIGPINVCICESISNDDLSVDYVYVSALEVLFTRKSANLELVFNDFSERLNDEYSRFELERNWDNIVNIVDGKVDVEKVVDSLLTLSSESRHSFSKIDIDCINDLITVHYKNGQSSSFNTNTIISL